MSRPTSLPVRLPPVVASIAATTIGQLPLFLTGTLAVQIGADLDLSGSRLGIAVAAFFASAALCSALLGRFADRIGGARMMRLGTLPALVASVAIWAGVRSWGQLVAALVVAGMANGTIQPAANHLLSRTIRHGRQGFAYGVKQAAIPAATLLSGLAVPVVGATVGWRWAFLGAGVLAAGIGVLIPRSQEQRAAASAESAGTPTFARPALVTLAIGLGAGSAAVNALGAFFVTSAVQTGVSDSAAGLMAAAGSVASLVMRLTIGARADRRHRGHLVVVAGLAAAGSLGVLLLAAGNSHLLIVAAVLGYGAGWGWAGLFTFAVVRTHPAVPGRATGITQVGASTGACLGPLCFAVLRDHLGFAPAWTGAAALLLAASAIILFGRRALYTAGVVP